MSRIFFVMSYFLSLVTGVSCVVNAIQGHIGGRRVLFLIFTTTEQQGGFCSLCQMKLESVGGLEGLLYNQENLELRSATKRT
jgi:hypothetical protein